MDFVQQFESFVGVNPWTALFILLNTLTIFFVGKKYLFGPVMKIIESRQKEIDDMYESAGKAEADAKLQETLSAITVKPEKVGTVGNLELEDEPRPGGTGKGTDFMRIWKNARGMYDRGESNETIEAYIEKFSVEELTDEGAKYIIRSLGLDK